jgi:CHAT domain-containing protein/tetratricopeptide (TPR) repeat protein
MFIKNYFTLLLLATLLQISAFTHAQQQQFPGMQGQPPIIMPGGGIPGMGGQVDCKMLLEMMNKPGMPPQMQAMLSMLGCAPGGAAVPKPTPAPQPAARNNIRCDMYSDMSYPMPQLWLGPLPVLNAREVEGCQLAPLNQQLMDGLRYFGEGRLQQSAAAFQAVAAQTPDPALRLRALAELAKTQLAARQTAEARATLEQALPLAATTGDARNRAVLRAELLVLLGVAHQQGNDLAGAIARYREANALTPSQVEKSLQGQFSDPTSEIASPYLAAALLRAGQSAEARTLLQRMVQGREQNLEMAGATKGMEGVLNNPNLPFRITLPNMDAKMEAMSIYSGDIFLTPFTCTALAGIDIQAQSAEGALETVEKCRGRALASLLANRAFHTPERTFSFPSTQELQAEIRKGTAYHFERQAERVRAQQEAARNPNPRARAAGRPATIDEMRRMAAERNATLVVYAIDYEPGALPVRMPDRETGVIAWVVAPDGRVSVRRRALDGLFPESTLALSAAALRLRESMGVPGRGEIRAAAAAIRAPASGSSADLRRFHQLLIEPINDLLPTQEGARLIIVPERALFLVPFAALENSAGEPLIVRHAMSVVPSLQTLALAALRKHPAGDAGMSVVVGNPLMPSYSPRPGGRPIEIPPLPGAEAEANAVAALLKTNALTGAAATKSAVLSQATGARYIHLATHGFLDRFTDQAQSGVNPHVREIALFDETAEGGVKTPGMLALAPSGSDNGMLTADEIALSTTKAELVVMSACDSGRGAINDDGVIGLSRAWMAAGAPSVMVTLWTIPDDATKDLMVAFYQHLAAGTRKAEALRLAILAARAKYPDPFNWAAFMLIGEPD